MPSGRLLFLLLLGGAPSLMAPWWPAGPWLTALFDLSLLLLALVDLWWLPRVEALEITRRIPEGGYLGEPIDLELTLRSTRRVFVRLVESPPRGLGEGPVALGGWVGTQSPLVMSYTLLPTARGRLEFGPTWCRIRSPLGLVWRDGPRRLPGAPGIALRPSRPKATHLPLPKVHGRAGQHQGKRPGVGGEFLALREYGVGEGGTRVDWKATARRGAPVVRQFAEERSLSLILVMDCSRAMGRQVGELTRLDYAIEGGMALAQGASRQGDRVGMLVLRASGDGFLPPRSGGRALPELRALTLDLQPGAGREDLGRILGHLERRPLQEAVLVIFTEVEGAEAIGPSLGALALIQRRHQIVMVTIKDRALESLGQGPVQSEADILRRGAALTLLEEREEGIRALRARGISVVDAHPGGVIPALQAQYSHLRGRP